MPSDKAASSRVSEAGFDDLLGVWPGGAFEIRVASGGCCVAGSIATCTGLQFRLRQERLFTLLPVL